MFELAFVSTSVIITMTFLLSKFFLDDAKLLTALSDQPKLRRDGSDWGVYPETEP